MHRKHILTCMAIIGCMALALPVNAMAENKPTLEDNGGILPAGAKIVATNVGEIIVATTSGSAVTKCQALKWTGEVTKNKEDAIEAKFTTADMWGANAVSPHNNLGECTEGPGGKFYVTFLRTPLLLKSTPAMATDEFQLSGTGGNIRLLLGFTAAGECEYEATSNIKGDFTTGGTQASLSLRTTEANGWKSIRGGFLCPTSFLLQMTLNLETEAGEPVKIAKTP
jgi:hypothetical protein